MILALCVSLALAPAPSPRNQSDTLIDQAYHDMYNLQFSDAHRALTQWEAQHPKDPLGPVSDAAAYLFTEFDRLHILRSELFVSDQALQNSKTRMPDPQIKTRFDEDLARSQQLADAILKRSPDDETALFATVLRLALDADYKALIAKQYWASLQEIKRSVDYAQKLLAKYPDCDDAYLALGIENYLLSLRPAPERWFLRLTGAQADRKIGIEDLRKTAQHGHYLKPYAKVLLAIAALRANNKPEAKQILAELARQFPNNDLFRVELRKVSNKAS